MDDKNLIYDSKDYIKFTGKSQIDKAIHTLEGILKGIIFDDEISLDEILEVVNWYENHKEFASEPPFNILVPLLRDVLEDGVITKDEHDDLIHICKISKTDNKFFDEITSDLQRLQGILHGIIADGVIKDSEVITLNKWLIDSDHLSTTYPYDELIGLLSSILKDNIITDHEREMLERYFIEFIGEKDLTCYTPEHIAELKTKHQLGSFFIQSPDIKFNGHSFCFSGASAKCSRKELKEIIETAGGIFKKGVSSKVQYLIVGDEGNQAWTFAQYGRKIEQALALRKQGTNILIVNEHDFWDIVEDLDAGICD